MEQQVMVILPVQPAPVVEEVRLPAQAHGLPEGLHQPCGHGFLLRGKLIWVLLFQMQGRQLPQGPCPFSIGEAAVLSIQTVQQPAVLHAKVGVSGNELALQLEHHDGNGMQCRRFRGKAGIMLFRK